MAKKAKSKPGRKPGTWTKHPEDVVSTLAVTVYPRNHRLVARPGYIENKSAFIRALLDWYEQQIEINPAFEEAILKRTEQHNNP